MKKVTLIITCLFGMSTLFAQTSKNNDDSGFITCSEFHITKPLSEIFANYTVPKKKHNREEEQEDRDNNIPQKFLKSAEKDGAAYGNDPATMQTTMGTTPGRAPIHNFAGQSNGQSYPLDPTGAAGPNHYVQMVNATTFKVYNKTTGASMLTGTLGNLWPTATPNDGDPIVLYDKAADRWFMSQFGQSGNKIFIAVSTSSDPTGTWYTYTFTSPIFPDYLKFSVWQDGYYMTSNQSTQKVFAFERAAMLTGNSGARALYKNFSPPNAGYFFVPLAGDSGDGTLAPAGTPCPIFMYSDNGWGTGYIDAVNIYKMAVDWVPATPTATITSAGTVPTAAFDGTYNQNWNDCPQPNGQMLDGIGGTLMFRAQWKTWATAGYNSVVLNWAVKISSTQRSIKWCELRQNIGSGVWSMFQEGIYTPDANTRWMGSIAMDNYGSIALCYMKSNSSSIYPGLYYTGRRSCDPLGTFPITETVAMAGTASQGSSINRDGDYSETWLDPDGITFWHTGMYMGTGGPEKTQIYSFQITPCTITNPPVASFSTAQTSTCSGDTVSFNDLSSNLPTSWSWSFPGGTPSTSALQYPAISYSTPGTYSVTLRATNGIGTDSITMTNYVTVNPTPARPAATSNSPLCSGQTIDFNTPTVAGATYSWTGPIAFSSATQNPTRVGVPALSGTYSLTVTVNGCTSLVGLDTVLVKLIPAVPTITSNSPVCIGNTITMTTPAVTGATYSWTGPDSYTSTSQNQSITNSTSLMSGTYTVVVSLNGCSNTSTSAVVIGTVPITPIVIQHFSDLTSSSLNGNQWYLNGVLIPGATSQHYNATTDGVYTVVVTNNGCASAASTPLTIVGAGITELTSDNSLSIFPNPTDGAFTVSFHSNIKKNYTIKLVNSIGQLVYIKEFTNVTGDFTQNIDVSAYAKGIYMFILNDDNNQAVKKVEVY